MNGTLSISECDIGSGWRYRRGHYEGLRIQLERTISVGEVIHRSTHLVEFTGIGLENINNVNDTRIRGEHQRGGFKRMNIQE
jgi:hypothetical protein